MSVASGLLGSPLLKLPFLLALAKCYNVAQTPPVSAPDAAEQRTYSAVDRKHWILRIFETTSLSLRMKSVLAHAINTGEIYAIVATVYPSLRLPRLYSLLAPLPSESHLAIHTSPIFILGWTLACAGALLRFTCYRHLGKHFTFQLSIRKDHQLVKSGPYSVVRHPAYTAGYLFFTGLLLCQFGSGSWWREYGMWNTVLGKVVGTAWLMSVGHVFVMFAGRTVKEDEVLKDVFKEQWVEWSKETPYRLFPYIY